MLSSYASSAFKILLLLAIGLALLKFSPLGTSDRSDKYAQDLFNHYLGAWFYPDTSQDKSVVLLLTDEVVDSRLKGGWPAPYDFHGDILNRLLLHDPASVFIDFFWMNQNKPGVAYLLRVLRKYQSRHIPVYMAVRSRDDFTRTWPELQGLVIPVAADIGFDPSDFVARQYLFNKQGLETAAFSMGKAVRPDLESVDPDSSMDIFWGARENLTNAVWMEAGRTQDTNWMDAVNEGFTGFTQRTPYSTTLFVRDLLNPVADTEAKAEQELRSFLQGKHVFYGANLSGVQDIVLAPTREILPGVYYHAMAFDNLLTWGPSFKAADPHVGPERTRLPMWLLDLAVLLPVVLLGVFHHERQRCLPDDVIPIVERRLSRLRRPLLDIIKSLLFYSTWHIGKWLFGFGALIAWVVFCSWVEFHYFNVSAASWLGYLGVISLGFATEKLELIDRSYHWLKINVYQEAVYEQGTIYTGGVCNDPATIDSERISSRTFDG